MTDQEGLRVIWAVKNVISYILGMPFRIVTDHAVLKALRTKEHLKGRMRRWAKFLANFNYEILYRKESEKILLGLLSRALLGQEVPFPFIPEAHKSE